MDNSEPRMDEMLNYEANIYEILEVIDSDLKNLNKYDNRFKNVNKAVVVFLIVSILLTLAFATQIASFDGSDKEEVRTLVSAMVSMFIMAVLGFSYMFEEVNKKRLDMRNLEKSVYEDMESYYLEDHPEEVLNIIQNLSDTSEDLFKVKMEILKIIDNAIKYLNEKVFGYAEYNYTNFAHFSARVSFKLNQLINDPNRELSQEERALIFSISEYLPYKVKRKNIESVQEIEEVDIEDHLSMSPRYLFKGDES